MSQQDESEGSVVPATRVKRKKSEETIIKDILKLLRELKNDHRTPYLLSFPSKYGQLQFGSNNVLAKFQGDFANDGEWQKAFDEDNDEITEG